jgi:hypothetical protein
MDTGELLLKFLGVLPCIYYIDERHLSAEPAPYGSMLAAYGNEWRKLPRYFFTCTNRYALIRLGYVRLG